MDIRITMFVRLSLTIKGYLRFAQDMS